MGGPPQPVRQSWMGMSSSRGPWISESRDEKSGIERQLSLLLYILFGASSKRLPDWE